MLWSGVVKKMSLRKLSSIRQQLTDRLNVFDVDVYFNMSSIMSNDELLIGFNQAEEDILRFANDKIKIHSALTSVRKIIGVYNQELGIDDILTEININKVLISQLSKLASAKATEPHIMIKHHDALCSESLKDSNNSVLTERFIAYGLNTKQTILSKIQEIKNRTIELQDALDELNFQQVVKVEDYLITELRELDVI